MKKIISLILACVFVCTLWACSQNPDDAAVTDAAASRVAVDVDLTKLSSTMVYSEVFNMTNTPENYLGKTVRMRGKFSIYENTQTGARYFACVIADAASCCSQGIEFAPDLTEISSLTVGTEITVRGEFTTYEEDGTRYCQLKNAHLE